MKAICTLAIAIACTLTGPGALAQALNFVDDIGLATGPRANKELLNQRGDSPHFPAGSAVWGLVSVASTQLRDINEFSGSPEGGGALRVTIEMQAPTGDWNLVDSRLRPLHADGGRTKATLIPLIPDKPNGSQPFNQLLTMISDHKGSSPIAMRVRIQPGDGSSQFIQNVFYIDVANGLGRYGDWLMQRTGASKAASDDFEHQHLQPRSTFVKSYRSRRTDPRFVEDVRAWWRAKVGGSSPLSTKICSDDYIVFRDRYGEVTDKQLCALVTYKEGSSCFAMMRRFSYPRVGKNTFDTHVVDATYANQQLPADDGEAFAGAHPYAIDCSAAK